MTVRLGDLLVRKGVLTEAQRRKVVEYQQSMARPFGELAERLFGVKPSEIEEAWAEQYAELTRHVDPLAEDIDPEVLPLIDRRQAWQFRFLPLRLDGQELMACTTRENLARALKFAGWRVVDPCFLVVAEPEALGRALMKFYPLGGMTPEMVRGRGLEVA
jgi:hypothetical protein